MKQMTYALCAVFSLFTMSPLFANTAIFPNAFETHVKATQQCAVATDNTSVFCTTFKAAVQGCSPLGPLPMQQIYNMMMQANGNDLTEACNAEAPVFHINPVACVAQWNCYWNGGKSGDMSGLCDGTGAKCDTL